MVPDRLIVEFDRVLRTLAAPARSRRPHPDAGMPEAPLSEEDRRCAAGLMRVNHSGEVCAQALYQGQALTAHDPMLADELRQAADEETEHLAWTEARLRALGVEASRLDPILYLGSLGIGMLAGRAGDRWSLGFLAETEKQVEAHLHGHLQRLPAGDLRSRRVIEQMKADEAAHAKTARRLGGRDLPFPLPLLMRTVAGVMTRLTYRV